MKYSSRIIVCAILTATVVWAVDDSGYKPESRSVTEVFTSKVVKVYSFQEADVDYDAYVVTWKDHEVVVVSYGGLGADKHYQVGDTIRCQMQQMPYRLGGSTKARVMFSVLPAFGASATDELHRLESIRADVEARRATREAEAAAALRKEP